MHKWFYFSVLWHNGFYIPVSRKVSLKQCHMAVLAQSRGNHSKRIVATVFPSSTVCPSYWICRGASRRPLPGPHLLYNNRGHLVVITSFSHQTSWWSAQGIKSAILWAAGCPGEYSLLHYENIEEFILPLYVTWFNWVADYYPQYYYEMHIHGNCFNNYVKTVSK